MAVVALDRDAARAAISAAAGRFTALLRETDDIERPAAGTNWTVAETAAHVSCLLTGFSATIAGELPALKYLQADFPTRLAASNAATIAMIDHTDAIRLAELITAGAQRFLELVAAADPQMECERRGTARAGPVTVSQTGSAETLLDAAFRAVIVAENAISRYETLSN